MISDFIKANPRIAIALIIAGTGFCLPFLAKGSKKAKAIGKDRLQSLGPELCLVGLTVFLGAAFNENSRLAQMWKQDPLLGPWIGYFVGFAVLYWLSLAASSFLRKPKNWYPNARRMMVAAPVPRAKPFGKLWWSWMGMLLFELGLGGLAVSVAWRYP